MRPCTRCYGFAPLNTYLHPHPPHIQRYDACSFFGKMRDAQLLLRSLQWQLVHLCCCNIGTVFAQVKTEKGMPTSHSEPLSQVFSKQVLDHGMPRVRVCVRACLQACAPPSAIRSHVCAHVFVPQQCSHSKYICLLLSNALSRVHLLLWDGLGRWKEVSKEVV